MAWLNLDADEGPVFQSQRVDRYRDVIDEWLAAGKAYHCYCSKDEIDELRRQQTDAGERVLYGGRCRKRSEPESGVDPVVRFKDPLEGEAVEAPWRFDIREYQTQGYLPQATLNYLVRLGWSHGDQEIFAVDETRGDAPKDGRMRSLLLRGF